MIKLSITVTAMRTPALIFLNIIGSFSIILHILLKDLRQISNVNQFNKFYSLLIYIY